MREPVPYRPYDDGSDALEKQIRDNDGSELGLLKVIAYILLAILRKIR